MIRKLIGIFLVLLLMPIVLGQGVDPIPEEIQKLFDELGSKSDHVPQQVIDSLTVSGKNKFNSFDIDELEDGTVKITYKGSTDATNTALKGDQGIEVVTRIADSGNPDAKMPMVEGSSLSYREGKLVKANIITPIGCVPSGFGKGACQENYGVDSKGYELGDYAYPVAPGSRIEYEVTGEGDKKKEKVTITIPSEGEIMPPEQISGESDPNSGAAPEITYKLEDPKGHLLLKENKLSRFDDKFDFSIGYDTEARAFFSDNAVRIENFNLNSLRTDKTYLYFGGDSQLDPKGSALYLRENGEIKMISTKDNNGFSIEFVDYVEGMKQYGGINLDTSTEGANVWYAHGKGKDPEGNTFSGDSSVVIDPVESKKRGKIFAKTKGAFSHVNRNRFIHLNENEGHTGPREYYFQKAITIEGEGGASIDRDFTDTSKKSTITQIDFKDTNGKPFDVVFKVNNDGKLENYKTTLNHDLFIDNAGGIIRPNTDDAEKLLGHTGFFYMDKKARDEAIIQINSGVPVAKILDGGDVNKRLTAQADERIRKAAEAARKAEEARKAAAAASRDNGFPDFLQGVPISPTIVQDLDEIVNDRRKGLFVKKVANGNSNTIAIVISSAGCNLCPGFIRGIGNPGGNVYEIKDDIAAVRTALAETGIKITEDTQLRYPSTVFIDTKTGTIKGYEVGAIGNGKFNNYFR